ncbi:hypothetical protein H5P33_07660 [Mycolicibacterium arabiense]|uniref:hypothetical protein n=1 Tax=Mycolicibacterium arabiense TaxID=1286181 RepID=UPI0013D1856B|nr:hypothetical protein [Mycolicibacterium arabiense]MCV7372586.1 hypothetical protein [Mycolicibacterium arabiense]
MGKTRIDSRRLQLAVGGAIASGALLFGASAGVASAEPAPAPNPDCFGIPQCAILPGLLTPTGNGGGGYANGTAGGGYATGEAGGGYATGEAGGAFSRGEGGGAFSQAE